MNPFRESAEPAVPYNKTEVDIARIRETEETKRQKLAAREKTKQTNDGYWVIRGIGLLVSVVLGITAGLTYNAKLEAEHPQPLRCTETSEIVTVSADKRSCQEGWIEATQTNVAGQLLIRCHCSPKPVGSAP